MVNYSPSQNEEFNLHDVLYDYAQRISARYGKDSGTKYFNNDKISLSCAIRNNETTKGYKSRIIGNYMYIQNFMELINFGIKLNFVIYIYLVFTVDKVYIKGV